MFINKYLNIIDTDILFEYRNNYSTTVISIFVSKNEFITIWLEYNNDFDYWKVSDSRWMVFLKKKRISSINERVFLVAQDYLETCLQKICEKNRINFLEARRMVYNKILTSC
jgi:hypothetical protein